MNAYRLYKAALAELESLYNAPESAENKTRIAELEEELDSLSWELDARIY